MATISKGITLTWTEGIYEYDAAAFSASGKTPMLLTNLLEIPEVGPAESGFEQIDITTLADSKMVYMNGLETTGEPEALEFKFLYEKNQFKALENGGSDTHGEVLEGGNGIYAHQWMITLPDGSTCKFLGKHSVRLEGVGVNAAITYILSITPDNQYGEFQWEFPADEAAATE